MYLVVRIDPSVAVAIARASELQFVDYLLRSATCQLTWFVLECSILIVWCSTTMAVVTEFCNTGTSHIDELFSLMYVLVLGWLHNFSYMCLKIDTKLFGYFLLCYQAEDPDKLP